MAKSAFDAIGRAGITKTDQLLTEALLNPELAKALMTKATPGNRPFIAQRLASQLGTLVGVAGASQAAAPPAGGPMAPARRAPAAPPVITAPMPWVPQLVPGGAVQLQR
jgi:hypothetical protein